MGFDPLSLGVGGALIGGTASVLQARGVNTATERAAQATATARNRAIDIQSRQVRSQGALEREKVGRAAQQLRGRIRVAAGENGIGLGGTAIALLRQADLDEASNVEIATRNEFANIAAIRSARPGPTFLPANPFLAGLTGTLGGFQTGLSIGTDIEAALARNRGPVGDIDAGGGSGGGGLAS